MLNNILELAKISSFIGVVSGSFVFLSHTLFYQYDNNTDWKDIALFGTIGVIMSSRVAITDRKWFGYY